MWRVDPNSDCCYTAILDESGEIICEWHHDIDDPHTKPGDYYLARQQANLIVAAVNDFHQVKFELAAMTAERDALLVAVKELIRGADEYWAEHDGVDIIRMAYAAIEKGLY